jgi:hypothetical protein
VGVGAFVLIVLAMLMLCGGMGAYYGVQIPHVGFAGLSMGTMMTVAVVWVLIKR